MNRMINGNTHLYGIIGQNVSHSFSPAMQTIAFESIGYNAVYLPFPIAAESIDQALPALTTLGVRGVNITIPYKEKFAAFADTLDPISRSIGSVNTLVYRAPRGDAAGGWDGYTTDGSGFLRSLSEENIAVAGKRIHLLGAGGAAKSIAAALCASGALSIHIENRTIAAAEDLAAICGGLSSTEVHLGFPQCPTDILINTTSVGMDGRSLPTTPAAVENSACVCDIIYNPQETPLLALAEQLGKECVGGLGMLLYQGVEAFALFTRKQPSIEAMRNALDALSNRGS